MSEKTFQIGTVSPVLLLGINDSKLNIFKSYFPKLKIVARGNDVKAMGDDEEINRFGEKLDLLIKHAEKYNRLTESNIDNIMVSGEEVVMASGGDEVLVFGNNGIKVSARTVNQRKLVEACEKNDMVFAIGPAGTGKTYTAVALAVRALKNRQVRKIILTRPAVEAGESLGFLPGDLKEKLDPYLQPLYDALRDMIPAAKLSDYLEQGIIQIAPLAFMRGRTLDHAFVILDEAQNATESQLKMFLTRMGKDAKFVITGDITQIDLPPKQKSGLTTAMNRLGAIKGIEFVQLDQNDVIRHKLVSKIINAYNTK